MSKVKRTVLHDQHTALGATMVEFGGWEMPIQYPTGIVREHLACRKGAGLFDVSHMGRFLVKGSGAQRFLQHVFTSNVEALDIDDIGAQYTIIPNETGGAIDDAYLYRFSEMNYLLVVNASNRKKDWHHLQSLVRDFKDVDMEDHTEALVMIALQGPLSRDILSRTARSGCLPGPARNRTGKVTIAGYEVNVARTGYTGEPLCFELFANKEAGPAVWELFLEEGATPVGLGARDTLRLEAGLPLYGNELGVDPEGVEIPIMACPLSKFAVSFSPLKKDFVGRKALTIQFDAFKKILNRDYSGNAVLPRLIRPVAVSARGVARKGAKIMNSEKRIGYVTSGTRVPFWIFDGEGLNSTITSEHSLRSICLAYLDCDVLEGEKVTIEIRGKEVEALVVPHHMRSDAAPYARPILFDFKAAELEIEEKKNEGSRSH